MGYVLSVSLLSAMHTILPASVSPLVSPRYFSGPTVHILSPSEPILVQFTCKLTRTLTEHCNLTSAAFFLKFPCSSPMSAGFSAGCGRTLASSSLHHRLN